MSHFTVAVFTEPNGKTVEELLAPYHEFECTGKNDQYVIDVDKTEEKRKEYESQTKTMYQNINTLEYINPYDNQFYREPTEDELDGLKEIGSIGGSGYNKNFLYSYKDWKDGKGHRPKIHYIPNNYKEVEIPFKELYTFTQYLEEYEEINCVKYGEIIDIEDKHKYYYFTVDENGEVDRVIQRTNPDSKWDWYQIGGRWQGILKLKTPDTEHILGEASLLMKNHEYKEGYADSVKIKDIDFSIDKESEEYKDAIRFWELKIDKQEPVTDKDEKILKYDFYKEEYYTERYSSKEDYANQICSISTYAVITPDGVWHSKGDMGWFGCSSESGEESNKWNKSYYETFIKNADPEWNMTIVDCHI